MHRVILIGAGPLGRKVIQFILDRPNLSLVGVVDTNPALRGKPLHEIIDGPCPDLQIVASVASALATAAERPEVAIVTTVSSITRILPILEEIAKHQLDIVTTCEEMSFPWVQHPAEAGEIDQFCKDNGVSCLGTGVNPGFLMDYLPAVLSAIHQRVDHILVERVQDASARRVPFQQKIGAGLTLAEFEERKASGTLRHVGLPESLDMIAAAIGWNIDKRFETLEPVVADRLIESGCQPIPPGCSAGVEQIAAGSAGGREVLRLRFRAAVGEGVCFDRIRVQGNPGAEMIVQGGINGDIATCAITINAVHSIVRAAPGLQTMLDIPVPAWSTAAPVADETPVLS